MTAPLYRIDKFIVPPTARNAFMARLRIIQQALEGQPGCRQNLVLSQTGGPGDFNVITVVEWASPDAMAAAQALMRERYAREGFDPLAFMRKLGVRADMAQYAVA